MKRFVVVLFGVGLIGLAVYLTNDYLRLQRHGVRATGTIVDASNVHEVRYDPRNGLDTTTSHKAVIEFTPEGASAPRRISAIFWTRQTVGNAVRVLYDPNDAGDAKVDDWTDWLLPLIAAAFGALCLAQAFGFIDDVVQNDNRWTLFRWND